MSWMNAKVTERWMVMFNDADGMLCGIQVVEEEGDLRLILRRRSNISDRELLALVSKAMEAGPIEFDAVYVCDEPARTALDKVKTGDTLLERYRRALERISEHEVEEPAQIAHDALHPKKSTTLTGALHSGSKLPHG